MKKIVETVEVKGEGLEALLGKNVLLFCANYFYHGKLIGVNSTCVLLENAGIVYQTGELNSKTFTDLQMLPGKNWYVQTGAIESFGESGR